MCRRDDFGIDSLVFGRKFGCELSFREEFVDDIIGVIS